MGTKMANCEDPDEMHYNVAFHQGLHDLLRLKQSSATQLHILENATCDPLNYTMGSPILLHPYVLENPSEYKG